jgi:putative endonuclease
MQERGPNSSGSHHPTVIARSEATAPSMRCLDCFAPLAMTGAVAKGGVCLQSAAMRQPCVYIMANKPGGTLYTGVTAALERRVFQHREGSGSIFARKYDCRLLVWYERYERMDEAIAREKQIKGGSRAKKLALIRGMNPEWRDLYELLAQ